MLSDVHTKARGLIDRAAVERMSPEEQRWLDGHLSECAECARHAEITRRTVRALDAFAFDLDRAAALRVENAVRERSLRLAAGETHSRSVRVGIAIAALLTLAGSLAMWQAAAWIARRWSVSAPAWQIGVGVFWLLPSALAGLLPAVRALRGDASGEGGAR